MQSADSDKPTTDCHFSPTGKAFLDDEGRCTCEPVPADKPTTPTNQLDGNRPLPFSRDRFGRFVREAWVLWAQAQPDPKPSWLVPYDDLAEPDKEADRQIGETIARWTLIGDAANAAMREMQSPCHGDAVCMQNAATEIERLRSIMETVARAVARGEQAYPIRILREALA